VHVAEKKLALTEIVSTSSLLLILRLVFLIVIIIKLKKTTPVSRKTRPEVQNATMQFSF